MRLGIRTLEPLNLTAAPATAGLNTVVYGFKYKDTVSRIKEIQLVVWIVYSLAEERPRRRENPIDLERILININEKWYVSPHHD